jgi:class 3 adenylate cyclase
MPRFYEPDLGSEPDSLSKLMDEAVREQGGFVRGFTGDGIMAVFGAPVALEDAPLRGCRGAQHPSTAQGPQGLASKHSPTISQRC